MGDVKLSSPRVKVIRDGFDPLELQTTNADLVLWDRTRARHKWPSFQDAAFLWLTFISWAAARRTGAISTDYSYEKWEGDVIDVNAVEDKDGDVDPTPLAPEPD